MVLHNLISELHLLIQENRAIVEVVHLGQYQSMVNLTTLTN